MEEIKEQIITYKTALLAQSKGFPDIKVGDYYNANGILNGDVTTYIAAKIQYLQNKRKGIVEDEPESGIITAVTQSLLQKWIREIHNINIEICVYHIHGEWVGPKYSYSIYKIYKTEKERNDNLDIFGASKCYHSENSNDTYELALEEGLFNALNLIENGK